ncbi:MAG: hypothetical protein WAL50_16005 [Kineosporiaceae bacterium]|jgi:hypothetical protein
MSTTVAALWAVAGLAFMVVAVMLWLHVAAARVALLWVAVWFLPSLTGDEGGRR